MATAARRRRGPAAPRACDCARAWRARAAHRPPAAAVAFATATADADADALAGGAAAGAGAAGAGGAAAGGAGQVTAPKCGIRMVTSWHWSTPKHRSCETHTLRARRARGVQR